MSLPTTPELVDALDAAYSGVTALVAGLDDDDLLRPSGCLGWSRGDLLFHLTGDAQRALVALATPSGSAPDTDFVGYWRTHSGFSDREAEAAHARWVRRSAAAFDRPGGIVPLWSATALAAVRAAAAAVAPERRVPTQGLVLALPDFLATLITEAVLHHLDLIAGWSAAPRPADSAMSVALATIVGLLGDTRLPANWDGCETLLKCTGRAALTESDRSSLGAGMARIPVFGTATSGY
ncbi:maleylpyruvate isomerase N-terminal domain-containing protein [Actinoplanes siamensis]|uniref:Maleylpyruvate isomerase n=1 Tax=Actinoplanes siamensis TaxID=1223317 RepID=A0A919TMX4_9ACTN|nr:maleylpyruvate isomerase N-terminal domain-containing protein [Actinoplanes siamensis]GIF07688.1 maleylpyruvate isomerase [Actinoplanes siamensis]